MKISEIYIKNDKTAISFEIYPPKDDTDGIKIEKLFENHNKLKKYSPALVSLTYGAGGTTRSSSLHIIKRLQDERKFNVMPHFTCVCTPKSKVNEYVKEVKDLGIENILALRGDYPQDVIECSLDFRHANDLVKFIKERTDFSIGVAGYAEGHIESDDCELDLLNLKRKIEAGGDVIYTQMFFDNEKMLKFIDKVRKLGIDKPVIPGILAVQSFKQLERMLSMARVTVPVTFMEMLEKNKDDKEAIKEIGIDFATRQCEGLIKEGVKGLHFYTLNKSYAVSKVLDNLSL